MGLGLLISGELPKAGILRRPMNTKVFFTALGEELKRSLPSLFQKHVFDASGEGNELEVQLHPAEEPVSFEVSRGFVECRARTNGAGPGYHAFLVEVLERVGLSMGIGWNWKDASQDLGDETGYQQSRDFRALQEEMLFWLRSVSRELVEQNEYRTVMISMPVGYPVPEDPCVATPMGFWSREWFRAAATSELSELHEKGSQFFPWWGKGFDSNFFRGCALTKMWVDVPWHPWVHESERDLYEFVLDCVGKARELDGDLDLPEQELNEIQSHLSAESTHSAPHPHGVGFKRRNMRRGLTGEWTASIPGYFYDDLEDDGETVVYWFGEKTIRASSITVASKDGTPIPPEQLLEGRPAEGKIIDFFRGDYQGYALIEDLREGDELTFCLRGRMATINNSCLTSIYFSEESDADWAIDTWKSVSTS